VHRQQKANARAAKGESWKGAGLMTARRHDCSRSGMVEDDEDDDDDDKDVAEDALLGEQGAQGRPIVKAQRSSASMVNTHKHNASNSHWESRENDAARRVVKEFELQAASSSLSLERTFQGASQKPLNRKAAQADHRTASHSGVS